MVKVAVAGGQERPAEPQRRQGRTAAARGRGTGLPARQIWCYMNVHKLAAAFLPQLLFLKVVRACMHVYVLNI